jgi:hypothetical protein
MAENGLSMRQSVRRPRRQRAGRHAKVRCTVPRGILFAVTASDIVAAEAAAWVNAT